MIHQYINNDYYIVMDVNSGSVHVVDPMLYDMIGLLSEKIDNLTEPVTVPEEAKEYVFGKLEGTYPRQDMEEAFSDIQELIDMEQLFTADVYKDYVIDFKKRKTVVKALCLHIAHDCNLACQYCFAEEGEYHGRRALMTYEVGKKALDFLVANSGNRINLEVDFFGGEPLMNWDVVKQLVAYGRSLEEPHHKKFRFTLTTNGVLLNDEIMEFCNKEMSNVVLSLDGRREVNDRMRPFRNGKGSYDLIVPKFQKFAKSRGEKDYFVRGTFTRNNLDFADDVLHFADLGFEKMSIEPVVAAPEEPYSIREEDLPKIMEEYDKLAKEYIKRHKEGKGFTFFHFMLDLNQGPCAFPAAVQEPSIWQLLRGAISTPAISLWELTSSFWEMWRRALPIRRSAMSLSSAMSMPRTSAGTASPDSTAAAAARPTPTISTAPLQMRMILDARCRKSALSVPL